MSSIASTFVSSDFARSVLRASYPLSKLAIDSIGGRRKPKGLQKAYVWAFSAIMRSYMASLGVPWSEVKKTLSDPGIARCFDLVVKSIIEYGLKKPIVLSAPFSVVYNLTNKCNLRCVHCFQSADSSLGDLMTKEQKFSIIKQMADLGTAAITFSGGEPLLSPDFWDCVRYATENSIYCSIDTNGTLIDDSVAEKLFKAGLRSAQVSIDSPFPEKHDEFRCMKGAFDLSMRGVKAMKKAGLFVSMGVTLTSNNIGLIDDFVALAKKHSFNRIVFYHLIPVGRGEEISDLDLTPKARAEAMEKLARIQDPNIEIMSETPHFATETSMIGGDCPQKLPASNCFPITAFFDMGPSRKFFRAFKDILGGCPAGRLYCNIQPNGDLTPCMFSPFDPVVGNLTKQSFKEAWKGFSIMWDRTKLTGFCGECAHSIDCGGCRARAVAKGNLMGPDYGCFTARYFSEARRGHRKDKAGSVKSC
jgi:radical SAM protein with 4Fe4S-binding SPASM domain